MLHISQKNIDLSKSTVLYDAPFTSKTLERDWETTCGGGDWKVVDGWLDGRDETNAGALVYSRCSYPGDILLDFVGKTVGNCDNDLNFSFCSAGWDYDKVDAAPGYIAGLGGWWDNKTGIEHYPQLKPWAATGLLKLEAEREYHIQAVIIGDHSFIFVDGVLIVELFDPLRHEFDLLGRVGLGAYHGHVRFRDLKVIRPSWESVDCIYTGEVN